MSTAIQPIQPQIVVPWKSTSAIKQRADAIHQLLSEAMVEATAASNWDGDFGKIPGTGGKPSLLKAGSEKILAMFEMAVDPIVEDLSTEECRRYRVTCRILHAPSQNFLGSGVGECSTDETKYKWKRSYSKKEYDSTDPDRRKIKHSQFKGNNGMWEDKEEYLIRTEPADLANTVLKMAKKRAQIDATLTVTGASSMFTQAEPEDSADGQQEPPKATRGKKAAQATSKTEDVKCASCGAVNGHLPSCKYHPKNVSSGGQPAETSQKPPSNEGAKQEVKGEVMPKTVRGMYVIKSSQTTKSGKGLELTVTNEDNKEGKLYVWHKHLQTEPCDLKQAVGKLCDLELSASTKKNTQGQDVTFYSVEHVHLIGAVPYLDDKPAQSPSAAEVGFDEPMNEEGW